MVTVRKMTIDDLPSLRLSSEFPRELIKPVIEAGSPSFVMEDEDGPLCAFGCTILWKGVCDVWFNLISREKTISQIRTIKRVIDEHIIILKLWRVQADSRCNSLANNRFLQALGFEFEGVKRKYYPDGEDSNMYARII